MGYRITTSPYGIIRQYVSNIAVACEGDEIGSVQALRAFAAGVVTTVARPFGVTIEHLLECDDHLHRQVVQLRDQLFGRTPVAL